MGDFTVRLREPAKARRRKPQAEDDMLLHGSNYTAMLNTEFPQCGDFCAHSPAYRLCLNTECDRTMFATRE